MRFSKHFLSYKHCLEKSQQNKNYPTQCNFYAYIPSRSTAWEKPISNNGLIWLKFYFSGRFLPR